jgi:2-isopropylmalate synthase
MRVVISELSGRGNLLSKAEEYQMEGVNNESVVDALDQIKLLESSGFSFESAEASALLLLKRKQTGYICPFELIDYTTVVEHRQGRGMFVEATVKVKIGNEILHTAGEGNGPVSALDLALRKALVGHYPAINHFHLVDFKVRILDSNSGTSAITRVLIDTQNGKGHWTTVGASTNIIEASWQALSDSVEYGLMMASN